jgi:hypothetical protein
MFGADDIHIIQAERRRTFSSNCRGDRCTRAAGSHDQDASASDRMTRHLQAAEAAQTIEIFSMPVSVAPAADGIDRAYQPRLGANAIDKADGGYLVRRREHQAVQISDSAEPLQRHRQVSCLNLQWHQHGSPAATPECGIEQSR